MNYIFIPLFLFFFTTALFFAFYIPGRVLLGKHFKSGDLTILVTSAIIGLVLWGWQGYLFGYLNIRWASYLYLFFFLLIYLSKGYHKDIFKKKIINFKKIDYVILLIIIFGVIGHNINYIRTGFIVPEGMITVIVNEVDHYWHSSMINEMVKRIPPFEPGMYGILKTNYHYWFNLVTAELIRVFKLPLFQTQYLGMYPFASIMLGLTSYILVNYLYPSKMFSRLTLFFFYFSSDAAYWLALLYTGKLRFDIPSVIEHSTLFIDNPPRAFSVIITLTGVFLLFKYVNREFKNVLILALLFSSLAGFKVYTAIGVVSGLGLLAVYRLAFKRDQRLIIVLIFTALLSAGVYLPVNANAGGLFFLPFERQRDFITYKPLGFFDMELRWRVYEVHQNILRLIQLGLQMSGIYLFAQFGLKLLGLLPNRKTWKILGIDKLIFFYSAISLPILLSIFFSLKVHVSESYNLMLPAVIFLNILAPLNITLWLENKKKYIIISILLVIACLIIPRWIYNVKTALPVFLSNTPVRTNKELKSYFYLRNNTPEDSLILVMNNGHFDSVSAIVSIFSERRMFLSGQAVMRAHNTMNEDRLRILDRISSNENQAEVNKLVKNNNIDYLLFFKDPELELSIPLSQLHAKSVFDDGYAIIMKVEDSKTKR